ncbi:DMT family transporter [Stenotrophomonas maltophilia]|uniref:DMT family transporter n=1 Tax=Stenotrophomonas maltophilia TaxID=40324 RepID=UPI0028953B2F|nr:DMT family transporter [Stenotrophomonas maltophilia]MDT3432574.1 DMT family transporter [Stenotrophomonas maltophilia]
MSGSTRPVITTSNVRFRPEADVYQPDAKGGGSARSRMLRRKFAVSTQRPTQQLHPALHVARVREHAVADESLGHLSHGSGFLVLVVAGQMIAAVIADHLGLMGLSPKPINLTRIAGVVLILVGAVAVHLGGQASQQG